MTAATLTCLLVVCALYSPHVTLAVAGSLWSNAPSDSLLLSALDLNAPNPEPVIPNDASPEEVNRFKEWKSSPLYVPSFDPKIIAIPEGQREFTIQQAKKTHTLFKEIVDEAIKIRNGLAPGPRLILKYAVRLISTFIKMRREELKIKPRLELNGTYFERLADMIEHVINESLIIKKAKGYAKKNIDVEDFRSRTTEVYDYIYKVLNASPVGGYLKYETMKLFMDTKQHSRHGMKLLEEASDLVAQFRVMGYEQTIFLGKRLAKLMRLFARGKVPDRPDDV